MNPFQSDNIWKKKARQGKAQQHPLTPQQEWQKQVNSSSLWLGGGVVLLALYLAAVRAGTVALDASAVVLIVVVGCFCVYTAASLGRLMKNKPEEKAAKKKKKACRVRIRQQDQAVFLRQRFEQLLALFVAVNAKAVGQQDHGIGQMGKPGRIVFAFHNEHPAGMDHFVFLHRPLPANANRHSAVSSRIWSSVGWLFRLWSSSSSTCIQFSIWPSV